MSAQDPFTSSLTHTHSLTVLLPAASFNLILTFLFACFKTLDKSGYLCFILGFLFYIMGIKEFTLQGTKCDAIGKAPGTWQRLQERMNGQCWWE